MNIRHSLLLAVTSLGAMTAIQAQEKLDIKLTGRALFDLATYSQNDAAKTQDGEMIGGAGIRDMRIGFKVNYGPSWFFRGDVTFANNKVSLKDIYVQYNFSKDNFLRAGHYTVPFGLSSAYGSAKKEYLEEPEGNVYQPGRRIGLMHTISNHHLWWQYGIFADNSALTTSTDKSGPQGFTVAGRLILRPVMGEGAGFHVGLSGMHVKAESDLKKGSHIAYASKYLTAVDKRNAIAVDLTDARWENKFTAEFQGIYRNFQLSSQYYWSHVNRLGGNAYDTKGFYVSARGVIINPVDYKYNYVTSGVDSPGSNNLELMLGYGFLDLEDTHALAHSNIPGMAGAGKMTDYSAGLSYFFNKYVTVRLNYHHMDVKQWSQTETKKVDALEFRVQYIF